MASDRTTYWREYKRRKALLAPLRAAALEERVSRWVVRERLRRLRSALREASYGK